MKSFAEFQQLDEGKQAKLRADRRKAREKLAGQMPLGDKDQRDNRPPSVSPQHRKEYAGQQKPGGALATIPRPRDIKAEREKNLSSQKFKAPPISSRAAERGRTIVNHKNNPARTPDDNVAGSADKLKEKAAKRKASSQTSSSETSSSGPQSRPAKGFASGVKTSLGGDVFDKNKSNRTRARRELGLKTGKAIKSAPGKAARFLSKGLKDTVKSGGTASDGGSVEAPKRGVYNG